MKYNLCVNSNSTETVSISQKHAKLVSGLAAVPGAWGLASAEHAVPDPGRGGLVGAQREARDLPAVAVRGGGTAVQPLGRPEHVDGLALEDFRVEHGEAEAQTFWNEFFNIFGISRRRLVGQLALESLIISLAGAGAALLAARWVLGGSLRRTRSRYARASASPSSTR